MRSMRHVLRIAVSAYSGIPPEELVSETRRFLEELAERCWPYRLYVGGYRGLMKTVVDEALKLGVTVTAIIPVEYEEDEYPEEVVTVHTGMSFKGRNVILVRSGELLAALGGGA